MDFLVAGLGFGALLVLAGYAVREFGVFLFVPTRIRKQFAEKHELAEAWSRLCRFGSNAAMIGGVAVWFFLIVAVVFAVSDKTGAYLFASVATVVSLAGAGAIYLAYRRFFAPAVLSRNVDVTTVAAGWNDSDVVVDNDAEPTDGWRPRIIPKPSAAIIGDMPSWGAVYNEPQSTEPDAPAIDAAEPPAPMAEPEAPETPAPAEEIVLDESEPMSVVVEPTAEPETPPVEAGAAELEAADCGGESDAEPVEEETPVGPEPAVAAVEREAEPEPAPVEQVIAEEPAPEAPPVEEPIPAAPRRFKSALLSDIDEPSAADASAKYTSTILADLSAVRLPDDGPRYRSTALVDLAKPEPDETESVPATERRPTVDAAATLLAPGERSRLGLKPKAE